MYYIEGNDVTQNYTTAKELYKKGCDLNDGYSCAYLGSMYKDGKGGSKNIENAKKFYKKACNLNIKEACELL